ncbi:hypothetical protein [Actinomyces vulturis]|uniref:hypothetical protein n=1 Tax=Actinomyces vulturis TaxID=1857645 RepID=UPI00083343C2|nr:hypothetical protein [Actinomyces vulturis]
MALYELAEAQLVPAQFGRPAEASAIRDALEAVRTQILDVLSLPIFPISWQPLGYGDALTALNPAGDVVVVMVSEHMDAATLIGGLAHVSAMSAMGVRGVGAAYPGGMEAFRHDWQDFRDAVPLRASVTDRLIVLTAHLADDVRTSLPLVAPSGVQVHTVDVRRLANGRHFVHVELLSAQPMDQVGNTLLVARPRRQEVEAASPALTERDTQQHVAHRGTHSADLVESSENSAHSDRATHEFVAPGEQSVGTNAVLSPTQTMSVLAPMSESGDFTPAESIDQVDHVATDDGGAEEAESCPVTVLTKQNSDEGRGNGELPSGEALWPDPWDPSMSEEALAKVAHALGTVTEVVWQSLRRGIFHVATIDTYGVMTLSDGRTFTDPTEAACHAQGVDDIDGWHVWRFGPHGPTLRQAWEEVRDVDPQMPMKPSGRRARS